MDDTTKKLWKIRAKSLAISASALLGASILATLLSDDFRVLLEQYTGSTFWGALLVLVLPEIAKHARNILLIEKARMDLGGVAEADLDFI